MPLNSVLGGMRTLPTNIRVASWLAVECLNYFLASRNVSDYRLDEFANYILQLVAAENIPEWDAQGRNLSITGAGDPIPMELAAIENLHELLECVREISYSQLYAAYDPWQVRASLKEALDLSALPFKSYDLKSLRAIPAEGGWGTPLESTVLEKYRICQK